MGLGRKFGKTGVKGAVATVTGSPPPQGWPCPRLQEWRIIQILSVRPQSASSPNKIGKLENRRSLQTLGVRSDPSSTVLLMTSVTKV